LHLHSFLATPIPVLDRFAKVCLVFAIFFFPLGHAPAYVFIGLTILAWLAAGGYIERAQALRGSAFAWAALILYGLFWAGLAYTNADTYYIGIELRKYAKLLFMLVAITLLQEDRWRKRALAAFALAMLITLILSMLSIVWHIPGLKAEVGNRVVFKDHIIQNLMMAFFVLIMLVASRTAERTSIRLACLALAVLATVNILGFVAGRTGYVALFAILAVFIACYLPARQRWFFALLALLLGLAAFQFSDTFRQRVETAFSEYRQRNTVEATSVGARLDMIEKSIHLIQERPVMGWGTGAYPEQYCRLQPSQEMCAIGGPHPHNQFLAFGVQFGMVGIFAYLAFLASAVQRSRTYPVPQKVLAWGLIAALLVDSLLHAPLFLVGEALFFTLMLAVVLAPEPRSRAIPAGVPIRQS